MRTEKGMATVHETMAEPTQNAFLLASKSYHNCSVESRAKLQIGTILLALQRPLSDKQQRICWALFEARLRDYVELKLSGGTI